MSSNNYKEKTWQESITDIFRHAEKDKDYAARKLNAEWLTNFIYSKVFPAEINQRLLEEKRTMLTPVIARIQFVTNKLNIPDVTDIDKTILGKTIKEKFFQDSKRKYLRTEKIIEPDGEFTVAAYPSFFVP